MDDFRAVDVEVLSQKENKPYFSEDENGKNLFGEVADSNTEINFVQQVGVLQKSQQPLKARNMATQPQNQTELLEKFRKLRQWQQQQQDTMFRQQQLAMETLKMEKSKLQTILAAQKKLQEQQHISIPRDHSPNLETASSLQDVMVMPSQPQHFSGMSPSTMMRPETEHDSRVQTIVRPNVVAAPVSIPTSLSFPVSGTGLHVATAVKTELSSSSSESANNLYHSQQQGVFPRIQSPANAEERLEGSLASFNTTVYPVMWNSSNYRLPWGSVPLSSGVTPLYGQPVIGLTSPGSPMSHLGMITNEMTSAAQGSQGQNSTQGLEGFRKYNSHETEIQSNLEMRVKEHNDALQRNTAPVTMTQANERQWSHDPGTQHLLASVESQADEADDQSEVDAMSGVYPLCDSESELGLNDDDRTEDVDTESDAEEDCEQSFENERTVIDLAAPSVESNSASENQQGNGKPDVNEEMRPIKPGIGSGSSVKTFEELLEQQLRLEEAPKEIETSHENANQKPQRTFLRKGQGLARFKGKSTSNKTVGRQQQSTSQSSTVLQKKEKKTGNAVSASVPQGSGRQVGITRKVASKSAQVLLEKGTDLADGKNLKSQERKGAKIQTSSTKGKTVFAVPTDKPKSVTSSFVFTRAREINPAGVLNSIDASFQMRLQELEEKQELEEEELEEFELLEQAAANASFSSNSSVVVKVLAKARGNAQGGKQLGGAGEIPSPVDTDYSSGDGKKASSKDQCALTFMSKQQENVSEDEDSDITLQEISLDSALELDEIKKKTAGDHQGKDPLFSDPTSFAIEDDFNDEEAWGEIKKQAGSNVQHVKNGNTDDYDDDDDDDDSDVTISDIFPLVTSTPPAHLKGGRVQMTEQAVVNADGGIIASTPPTSVLVTKLFPQLKPKQKPSQVDTRQPVNGVVETKPVEEKKGEASDTVQSIAVRQKLKELESEIEKFRTENVALAKMRTEREEGLKKLQSEIAAFEKQKTDELERLEQFREEELRKLRRERRVFEKYQKAARSMPDKKEREEMEALRSQVAELQEELKWRESRWSAASTRSRQRVEALEQQNKELQEEVKLLEHYRLQQWRDDEQAKTREEVDSRPKKPLQRKLVKTIEEETGPRLPLSHRSPPLKPALVEAVSRSTPENATAASENRSSAAETMELCNNRAMGFPQDENTSAPSHSRSREEISETPPINTSDSNQIHDIEQSKRRSPRRRSRTPDSGEKVKRNVHFQDEQTARQIGAGDSGNSSERTGRQDQREIMHSDGKVEKVNSDGTRTISFANGTRKEISADGQTVIVTFFNGDIKQIMPDQRVIYYYSEVQTTHTTYPDGLEVLQFPSNQIEKHYRDGTKEIIFPDQTIKYLYPNGAEECVFSDGTIQKVSVEGERTIEFPNGQRETHTKYYKKREYPDGTVKTVYPDGRTETRYSTGRVRVKDRDGRVLVDSSNQLR